MTEPRPTGDAFPSISILRTMAAVLAVGFLLVVSVTGMPSGGWVVVGGLGLFGVVVLFSVALVRAIPGETVTDHD